MPMELELESLLPLGVAFLAVDGKDYASLKRALRTWAKDDPMDALLLTAFGGGMAFYLAERGKNPNIETPWDAILYMATCFSVGYDNTFPTTPSGHALATMVQTFGPALAGMAFATPAAEERDEDDVNRQILARLDDIVRLLEARK
jgi:hypothetical protein